MNIYGKEASAYYDMHQGLRWLKRGVGALSEPPGELGLRPLAPRQAQEEQPEHPQRERAAAEEPEERLLHREREGAAEPQVVTDQ